eukprot:4592588-Prymnesium_polylepis.1
MQNGDMAGGEWPQFLTPWCSGSGARTDDNGNSYCISPRPSSSGHVMVVPHNGSLAGYALKFKSG